ncbi:hypothetical protein NPIL_631791 [Nephila pilipes]|uniref:Uncharacterized protein n=1 Tax=Nephila pilipes TaxID=299642 RepID=A0A8X6TWQ1_NEPPI|nr:hypothetical protein NPIL_631791 [Nephila pilipes]
MTRFERNDVTMRHHANLNHIPFKMAIRSASSISRTVPLRKHLRASGWKRFRVSDPALKAKESRLPEKRVHVELSRARLPSRSVIRRVAGASCRERADFEWPFLTISFCFVTRTTRERAALTHSETEGWLDEVLEGIE